VARQETLDMSKILPVMVAAATAALVAACGGSGSPSKFSAPTSANAAGTPVMSTGTITAFGSIFVNGVHFETGSAVIRKNGQVVAQSALEVGEIAHVKGSKNDQDGRGVADSIDVEDAVIGPIAAIDVTNATLTVLGQTVKLDGGTSFSANLQPADVTGLNVADFVEVSGLPDASAAIVATRIERKTANGPLQVLGSVSSIDTTAHTFKINALTVDYSTAMLEDFSTGQPQNGDAVEVHGIAFDAGTTTLTATRIELQKTEHQEAGDDRGMEREGLITRFVSATDFDVAGKPVSTTGSTVYRNGTAADLALNTKVEVEGHFDASNVLVADVVAFHRNGRVNLQAQVSAVNATAGTLTVLGIDITVNANTRLEDKSSAHVEKFSLSDLNADDTVEVRGFESPAGSGKLVATRLEREQPRATVEVRGPFTAGTSPQFTVLGITVDASTATLRGNGAGNLALADFLTQAVGKSVDVRGQFNGMVLSATEIRVDSRDGSDD